MVSGNMLVKKYDVFGHDRKMILYQIKNDISNVCYRECETYQEYDTLEDG
jgi:hypothetical protein